MKPTAAAPTRRYSGHAALWQAGTMKRLIRLSGHVHRACAQEAWIGAALTQESYELFIVRNGDGEAVGALDAVHPDERHLVVTQRAVLRDAESRGHFADAATEAVRRLCAEAPNARLTVRGRELASALGRAGQA